MEFGNQDPTQVRLDAELRDRLERYLEGSASTEDVEALAAWVAADREHAEWVERVIRARRLARAAPELWDADEAWSRLLAKVERGSEGVVVPLELRSRQSASGGVRPEAGAHSRLRALRPLRRRERGLGTFLRVAAAIAVVVLGTMVWPHRSTLFETSDPPMREIMTGSGERMRITLSDDSEIVLGSVSRLWVPERFDRERLVRLDGEAVFEVRSDPERPFVVQTDRSATRVLGTRFGVHDYVEDGYVEVVVAEGRVSVAAPDEGRAADRSRERSVAATLDADQAVRIGTASGLSAPRDVDAERLLSWSEGALYFEKTPLVQVSRTIERRRDVSIRLSTDDLADLRLTAEFASTVPTLEVLERIARSLRIGVREDSDGLLFYPLPDTAERTRAGESN